MQLVARSFQSLMGAQPPGSPIVSGFAEPGRMVVALQPAHLRTEWLALSIAVRAACGRSIGPISDVRECAVTLLSSSAPRDSYQLLQAITARAPQSDREKIEKRFSLLCPAHLSAPDEFVDFRALRDQLRPDTELLVIDDLRLMLAAKDRDSDAAEKIGPTLAGLDRITKHGLAVLAFVPQRDGPKTVDLRDHVYPAAVIRIHEDAGGPQDTGASVIVCRERSSPLDPVPARFRFLATCDDGALDLEYDFGSVDPEEERLSDRNIAILRAELAGRPRKELAEIFKLSESRLSRIVQETRQKLGSSGVARLAQVRTQDGHDNIAA